MPVGGLLTDGTALAAVWGAHGAHVVGRTVTLDLHARDGTVLAAS